MNTKVSDARQKLFDLRKKYSVANLKKYEKQFTSSNESLIESSESVSVSKYINQNSNKLKGDNVIDKEYNLSARSISNYDSGEKIENDGYSLTVEKLVENSSKESIIVSTDSKCMNDAKPVTKFIPDPNITSDKFKFKDQISCGNHVEDSMSVKKNSLSSDGSSIKSYKIQNDDHSEIEEILSDEDIETSSANDPFANIHLVSDDILDELDSSIGSHSSIKEDIHTGRLSAVQSVKSLQLSSPLEPPKLEYDYESDFESSDNENESFKSNSESEMHSDKNESVENIISSSQNHVIVVQTLKSDTKLLNNKQELISSPNHELNEYKITSNDSQKLPVVDQSEIKLIKSNSLTSRHEIESKISSKTVSSSAKNSEEEYIESVSEILSEDEVMKTEKNSEKEQLIEILNHSESHSEKLRFKKEYTGIRLASPKTSKTRTGSTKIEKNINLSAGGKPKLSDVLSKNIGVQTSVNIVLPDKSEKDDIKSALREKWYINTNVKSTKYRPVIKSSKLFKSSRKKSWESEYNPFMFTPQDGLPVDKLLDEILRNQIAMTKHFIDCHHRLYMQCCKTVKSLNNDYKKRNHSVLFI